MSVWMVLAVSVAACSVGSLAALAGAWTVSRVRCHVGLGRPRSGALLLVALGLLAIALAAPLAGCEPIVVPPTPEGYPQPSFPDVCFPDRHDEVAIATIGWLTVTAGAAVSALTALRRRSAQMSMSGRRQG